MAIQNPQPMQADGQEYPFLSVSLAMSTREQPPGMALALVVTLTPYRITESGVDLFEEGQKVLVWGDAAEQAKGNPHLAKFLGALQAAGQEYASEAL